MIVECERWFRELLGRETFRLPDEAAASFAGKSILVTGGAGSIGAELVRRLRELEPASIVVLDNAEDRLYQLHCELQRTGARLVQLVLGDINSPRQLQWTFERHAPQIVFHAAAHKHVDFLESQVLPAVRTNIFGTRNVLTASLAAGVESVVVLSSDKATNPVSVLGATKRVAEFLALANFEQASTSAVRLCNVLGTTGSLLPLVMEQVKRGVVTITDNAAERYFIAPSEAADLLLSAASARENGVLIPASATLMNIRSLVNRIVNDLDTEDSSRIEIEVTGLRQGERHSEELHAKSEEVEVSAAAGLMKATKAQTVLCDLNAGMLELEDAYSTGDENLVIEKLVSIVPEYTPSFKVSTPLLQ